MILLHCYWKRKGQPCKERKGKATEPFLGMNFPSSGLITVRIAPGEETEVSSGGIRPWLGYQQKISALSKPLLLFNKGLEKTDLTAGVGKGKYVGGG